MSNHNLMHIVVDSIPENTHSWVDILSALLVPTIAVVGLYIAYQQFQINKQRLRHETYERRLMVYKTVQRYLSEIIRDAKTDYDRALKFNSEASEAAFLFDASVQEKIDEIYKKSIDMVFNHQKLYPADGSPGLSVGTERSESAELNSEYLLWFTNELTSSRQFFAEKLGLTVT
ncbi:MAG: hypothetical protein KUG63_10290 [Cycloclasticus sp.]|jgi:hypothetical protein|uniref:hypothetical protein n=1 Tax=Cycloclasticus sp. TaxID=2024830 RepID=UPI0025803F9A|nr:hypothetical protein [Cycloclasticus sp.]MBV1899738.1 hypothetical protein [Cycloclasticus sp.]